MSYEGERNASGQCHGWGRGEWADGWYEGEWKNGEFSGKGIYGWSDGDLYVGDWLAGKRSGKGAFYSASGSLYQGHFKNELRHGKGTQWHANGNRYDGEWSQGQRHGRGIMFIEESGSYYECSWKNGQANGTGVFLMGGGDLYEGGFLDGNRHGKGVYTWVDGTRISAVWDKGVRDEDSMEDLPDRAITYSPPSSFKNKVPLPATNYAHKSKHSHIPLPSYRISNNRVSATRPSKNATSRSPSLANLRATETIATTTTTSGGGGSANSPFGVTLKSTKTTSTTTTSSSPSSSPVTVNKNTKSGKSQPLGGSGGGNKVYDGEAASRAVKSFTKKLPKFASKKKKSSADERDKEEKEKEKERLKEKKEREKKERQKEKEREKFRERQEKALREYELGDGFKRAPTVTGEVTTITISSPKMSQKPAKPITARKPSPAPSSSSYTSSTTSSTTTASSKPPPQHQPRAASPPLSPNRTRALPTPVSQPLPTTTNSNSDSDAEAKAKDEAELAAMPAWRRQVILKKRQREAEEKAKAEEKEKAKLQETQGKLRAAELERERQEKELSEQREREEQEARERRQEEEKARKQAELEERQREKEERVKKEQEEKARKEQENKEQKEWEKKEAEREKEAYRERTLAREDGEVMSLNLDLVRPDTTSPSTSPTSPSLSAADSLLADLTGALPEERAEEGDISGARIAPARPPKPTKPRSFAIKSPRGIFSSITSPRKMEGDTSSEKKPLKKRRKEEKRALKDAEKKAKLREADLRRKDEELAQKERELALEARELELREREEKLRQRAQHLSSSGSGAASSTSPTSTPPLVRKVASSSPQSSPPQSPRSRSRAKQRGVPRSARELSPEVIKRGDHSSPDLHKGGKDKDKEKEKEKKHKEKEKEKEKKEREKEAEKAEKEEKEREREKKKGRIFGKLKPRGPGKKGERKDDAPPVSDESFISSPINTSDPVSLNPHRFIDDRSRTISEMMYLDELEEDGGELVDEVLDSVQFVGWNGGGGEGGVGDVGGGEYSEWGDGGVTTGDGGVDYPAPPSSWGDEVEETAIQCPNCATSLPVDSLFCEECGHRLDWAGSAMDDPAPPSSPPEPLDYDETDPYSPSSSSFLPDETLYVDPPSSASVAQHILSPSAVQSKEAYLSTTFGGMDMLRESYDGRRSEEAFDSPVVPDSSSYDGRGEEMAFDSPVVPVSNSYDGTMASYKEKAAAKRAKKEKLAESYVGYQGGNWVCNKCNVTNIQDDANCMMCGNSQPPMVSPPPGQGQGDLPENENYRQKAPGRNTQIFSDMRIDMDNLDDFFS